jgi:hypothetical protein
MVGAPPNRINISDSRGQKAYLQVTRHRDQRKVVLSQWRDGTCVASTPLDVSELPGLISVLAEALGDATTMPPRLPGSVGHGSLWSMVKSYLRPTLARVVEFPQLHERKQDEVN